MGEQPVIEAAGGVLWRASARGVEAAVVHRPRYDDWSLPKGKLSPGEHPLLGALREIAEETGFAARPGRLVAESRYRHGGAPKRVRYWDMQVVGGSFAANDEVDELAWLTMPETIARLAPNRDRPIAEAFAADVRATTACVVVRHGQAGEHSARADDDRERPLDDAGRRQAVALTPLLTAFGARRVLSADVARCLDTVAPFAATQGVAIETDDALSADGFLADPAAATKRLRRLVETGQPRVLCGQGEAISPFLKHISAELSASSRPTFDGEAFDGQVGKGGFAVVHVDAADPTRLVAIDGYPPVL